jgi:hypothetical protein
MENDDRWYKHDGSYALDSIYKHGSWTPNWHGTSNTLLTTSNGQT